MIEYNNYFLIALVEISERALRQRGLVMVHYIVIFNIAAAQWFGHLQYDHFTQNTDPFS